MMECKSKTCCFSGHRKIPPEIQIEISRRLKENLIKLIESGYIYFLAGGALGFDTLAAQTVIELREKYPHIKLILILPCLSQANVWSDSDKRIYEHIKEKADKIVYTSQEYTRDCMHKRNRHLVDNSSLCICYMTQECGGTAYTVKYATKNELQIINLK